MISRWSHKRKIAVIVGVVVFLVLFYWPVIRWMVNSWLSSDYYSHGFLVPLISAFFIWIKRSHLKNREPSSLGYLFFVAALILYLVGFFLLENQTLGTVSLVIMIYGFVLAIWGIRAVKTLAFPLLFLLFMVPFGFIQTLALNLQYTSVQWAAWVDKTLGLPITTHGTEISVKDATFTVGIVCSGINTLEALLALAAVYVYILKGSYAKRLSLFALAIPIAIVANILRIASIIVVAYFANVEIAAGWYHDISSPLFFFLAFMLLVLIGWILKFKINYELVGGKQISTTEEQVGREGQPDL